MSSLSAKNFILKKEQWTQLQSNLDQQMKNRLSVAFLGSASCGKDSAIRSLFGMDFGEVSPIPGSTKELKMIDISGNGSFIVINTPGFGDINKDVDNVARMILDNLDIVIYIINAEGGVTIDEKNDFMAIQNRAGSQAATLVCLNKIDLIRPQHRQLFVDACAKQLGIPVSDIATCAFDPLPQISKAPIGLDQIISWLSTVLAEKGKHLLFAKQVRNKKMACQIIINDAAKQSAMAGALPIPGADMTMLTVIQVKMIQEIALVYDKPITQDVILWIVGELLSGASKGLLRWGLNALKAVGWIPGGQFVEVAAASLGAALAMACTKGVGLAAVEYFSSDEPLELDTLKEIFNRTAKETLQENDISIPETF